MPELGSKYTWIATLDDGSMVEQIDRDTGEKAGYDDLPLDRIRQFELWDGDTCRFLIKFEEGERLVWRRRVEMSPGHGVKECCHIVAKISDGVKGVVGIFESDGRIEIVPDYLPNSEWFYPPQVHKNETPTA